MSTIYLTKHGMEVHKDGGEFIVKHKGLILKSLPSFYVDNMVVMANVQITHAVIVEMLKNNRCIFYFDKYGRLLGELGNKNDRARILVRQLQTYMDAYTRQQIANDIIVEKIKGQRKLLAEMNRQRGNENVRNAIVELEKLMEKAKRVTTIKGIMGIEGLSTRIYFSVFDKLIFNEAFTWISRKKHPAPDAVNAMLSFGYFLIEKEIRKELVVKGLSVDIGYLHELDYRKESLVYDIIEPFRADFVDRFVLKCINLKMFSPEDFQKTGDRLIFMPEARDRFISGFENMLHNGSDCIQYSNCRFSDRMKGVMNILNNILVEK